MSGRKADICELRVPPESGEIERAFADLDEKLSAWQSAMLQAQEQICNAAGRTLLPCAQEVPEKTELVEEAVEPLPELPASDEPAMSEPLPGPEIEPESDDQLCMPEAESCVPESEEMPAAESERVPAQPETETGHEEEDQELLASLDPETAQAIRVMRRISTERRGVRELLEQYQKDHAAGGPARTEKGGWFFRRR